MGKYKFVTNGRKNINVIFLFFRLLLSLSIKRRLQISFLVLLMLLSGIAEAISLATIVPFLSILTNPESLNNYPLILDLLKNISFYFNNDIFFVSTLIFCLAALLGAAIRLLNSRLNGILCAFISIDISKQIYKNILFKPYEYHIEQESSDFISLLTEYCRNTESFIYFGLDVLTKAIGAFFYLFILIRINWLLALINGSFLGLLYISLALISKSYVSSTSEFISNAQTEEISLIQESIWGIRDVLLEKNQKFYLKKYLKIDTPLQFKNALQKFIASGPRYAIEALSIILIAVIAYYLSNGPDSNNVITTLGIFALGAQKLLPSIQQVYAGFTSMRSRKHAVFKVLKAYRKSFLKKPTSASRILKNIEFENKIEMKDIFYKYPSREKYSLEDINFTIKKGERIGIIGTTGSGKSTLLDILIGLLPPTKGKLMIDNLNIYNQNNFQYSSLISYVPQNIFLRNCSIKENIAFTDNDKSINVEKIVSSAKKARIHDFIISLPNSYDSTVGERGISLSGGQIQRIGIARAIYKGCPIIVFDEATSALDSKTEKSVMDSINSLKDEFTIVLVAHRISTVKNCDKILLLEDGRILKYGKPNDVIK